LGDFHGQFNKKLKKGLAREMKNRIDLVIGVGDYAGIEEWSDYIINMLKASSVGLPWVSAEEYFGARKFKKLVKKDEKCTKNVLLEINSLVNDKENGKGLYVFGNNDDDWYNYPFSKNSRIKKSRKRFLKSLNGMKDITYSSTKFNDVSIVGYGGYMDAEINWDKRKDDKESYNKMLNRVGGSRKKLFSMCKKQKPEILVLHYPPKGIFDKILDRKNPYHGKQIGVLAFRDAILKFKPRIALCGHMHEYQGALKLGKTLVINPGDASKGKFAVVDYDNFNGKADVRFVR